MFITRLKLVNFIGIKHGLDRDEVELNFSKNPKNKIVMLNGENGSGKSTLMSQLHPFKDSFDDRKTIIIDGLDGLKEIDIQHGDDFYEIVHHYKRIAQSFIKKNGVEMNENGGVKTFNTFIEQEFGLTNDYFKIGKIGSNTENFINFTATERKTYISKFLPDIADYLDSFAIIKDKFNLATNDIKTVSNDLAKLEQEETVKVKISSLETIIKNQEDEIERLSNESAVIQSDITNYKKEIENVDIAVVILDKSAKENRKNEILKKGIEFINKYSGKKDTAVCEQMIEDKTKITNDLNNEITTLNANKSNYNTLIISTNNEIKKIQLNLNELLITDTIEELEKNIKVSKDEIKRIEGNTDPLFLLVKNNQTTISQYLSKFETFKNFISKYFTNLREPSILPSKTNIEMFLETNFEAQLEKNVTNMRSLITQKNLLQETKKKELYSKESSLSRMDILSQRPAECGIECYSFIVEDAETYEKLPGEIKRLQEEIDQLTRDLESYEIKAENIQDIKNLYLNFHYNYDQMSPRNNIVYQEFVKQYGDLKSVINGPISEFTSRSEAFVETLETFNSDIQDLATLKTSIENLEYKRNFIKNNEKIKKQYSDSIEEKEKEKIKYQEEIKRIDEKVIEKVALYDSENKILTDYKEYLSGKREISSLSTMLSNLKLTETNYNDKTKLIKEKTTLLQTINTQLQDLRNKKTTSQNDLSKAKTILANIELLKTKKDNLEKDYTHLKLVKDALDPNRGIPLYFIKSYLEKTRDIVNELLQIAFDGDFEINFVTDTKEFFIQVRTGETLKNDIKEASQGEIALTTISISLALIEQAIGNYNIIALDEIDGPLDSSNRQNFISILNTQIEKLGIEQLFVISHNDAFDTEAMDLILLRGNNVIQKGDEFMKNKEIIFTV
jgi:DNA repair exonuclease SbcCD ATPase subunit